MKIKIKKFKSLENLEFEVPARISGANESGKTTVLEAISFCLTGKNFDGKTFKSLYDYRVELPDAVADVEYTDSEGNTYRRVVSPTYSVSRTGVSELKIKESTTCYINDVVVNDYAKDFSDFLNFGTDFFFLQSEKKQREIFVEVLKYKLPNFNFREMSELLAQLHKKQRTQKSEIKTIEAVIKELSITQKPTMEAPKNGTNLMAEQYDAIVSMILANEKEIKEISEKNAKIQEEKNAKIQSIKSKIWAAESEVRNSKNEVEKLNILIERSENETLTLQNLPNISDLEQKIKAKKEQLNTMPHYKNVEDFVSKNHQLLQHPLISENVKKIQALANATLENPPIGIEVDYRCPTCNEMSENYAKNQFSAKINFLRSENRKILTEIMESENKKYKFLSYDLDKLEEDYEFEFNRFNEIKEKNEKSEKSFDFDKNQKIERLKNELLQAKNKIKESTEIWEKLQIDLEKENAKELHFGKMPETLTLSDELKNAKKEVQEYEQHLRDIETINANNLRRVSEKEKEREVLRKSLVELDLKIIELKNEITEFLSNLDNIVRTEFSGKLDITVELQRYVVTTGEFEDVFLIKANGKIYPYELNGALQNNTKTQILKGLQKNVNYNGITIIDNVESNTTQPLDANGLRLVSAQANFENFKIEKL